MSRTVEINGNPVVITRVMDLPIHQRLVAAGMLQMLALDLNGMGAGEVEDVLGDLVELCAGDYMSGDTYKSLGPREKAQVVKVMLEGVMEDADTH